ncbi:MAG TPA: triphosphoribosyl-dephospho-CoA synthase MdcB [Burkholderiaceae bacterium]|nr:triphosphoribosyl-dephospho-CoA synthase MdcB [Burkholderiaceae bacterium]
MSTAGLGLKVSEERRPLASAAGLSERVGRLAVRSLYNEAALYPKPGLVSPVDNGSHADMSMATFYRSLFALRRYFPAITRAGAADPELCELQALGLVAERDMLRATAGVNTHRGAIFHLGLLCAATGRLHQQGAVPTSAALCRTVAERWSDAILQSAQSAQLDPKQTSHGLQVLRRYSVGGARAEAAAGFPNVMGASLHAYRRVLRATGDARRAGVQALFVLIERTEDSNLLWRGGLEGARFARQCATAFLRNGGAVADDWLRDAASIHRQFVARNLSPGGCADLLAVTLFLHACEVDLGFFL